MSLLEVRNLSVTFGGWHGAPPVEAVKRASFSLDRGETLALVGESGSGKSVTALSILQLLPYPGAHHPSGSIRFRGKELVGAADNDLRAVRGNRVAMIFQEPMTSLNPLHTVERQVSEALLLHKGLTRQGARSRALELLTGRHSRPGTAHRDAAVAVLSGRESGTQRGSVRALRVLRARRISLSVRDRALSQRTRSASGDS